MLIERLLIDDFRNLSAFDINPTDGFNLICGPNGSGKTSVLEAVSYLARARSFRGAAHSYLVQSGRSAFSIFARVRPDDEAFPVADIGISRGRAAANFSIRINGSAVQKLSALTAHTCVQVIHPAGIALVTGGPEERRHFIDWGLFYARPQFHRLYSDYNRVLRQRNTLLRLQAPDADFSVWNEKASDLSAQITALRRDYLSELIAVMQPVIHEFLPQFTFDFNLHPGHEEGVDLRLQMAQNLEKERVLGYTCIGCHRADLKIKSNSISAGATLSRGQLKLLVCAMRMSQSVLLKQQTNRSCIFLIDDLNAELDQRSQAVLLSQLACCRNQVFITSLTPELQLPSGSRKQVIGLEGGRLVPS